MKIFSHSCPLLLPLSFCIACLIFISGCGGGGDGSGSASTGPTGVPSFTLLGASPNTVTVERTVSFQITFAFRDTLGDLDNGTLYLTYGGVNYSATLPGSLSGVTDGGATTVSVTVPLDSRVGSFIIPVWIVDRAGNSSNKNYFALSQMAFGSQVWGSGGNDRMTGTAIDGSGNIYAVGYTSGAWDGELNQGGTDAFISKFDVSGNRQWTRLIGTAGEDAARGVAVDGSGNVYVVGEMDFLEGVMGSGFLAKYDSSGNIQWGGSVSISASELATARGVTLDNGGNIYVAGYAKGNLYPGQPDEVVHGSSEDPFLIKFDLSGNRIWPRIWGDEGRHDYGYSVTVDNTGGYIYVVGSAAGSWDGEANAGETDAFITKFDGSGVYQWTRFTGDVSFDAAHAVAVDSSGNIYMAGELITTLNLTDAFLMKYDSLGNRLWPSPVLLSSTRCDVGSGIVVDSSNHIYVSGSTRGDLAGVSNLGGNDAFLAKFDPAAGDLLWTKVWGTGSDDFAVALAVDSGGDIHVAGDTMGSLDGYTNVGGYDLYLVKFNSSGQRQ